MNFLRLRRTPKLALPQHETDIFFVDAAGVFKKMDPDGTVTEVGSGGGENGGSMPVQMVRVKLTDAQIKNLPVTPITLVAGVEDQIIWPAQTILIADTSGGAYSNILDSAEIGVGYGSADVGTSAPQALPGNYIRDDAAIQLQGVSNLLTGQGVTFAAFAPGATVGGIYDGDSGALIALNPLTFGGGSAGPWGDESPYDGLDLQLQGVNIANAPYEDGDPANSLIVVCLYVMIDL